MPHDTGRLSMGEVEIELRDESGEAQTYVLRPSLKAATSVNRAFGGFVGAYQKIAGYDFDAFVTVLRAGLGKQVNPDAVPEIVFATGLAGLIEPVARYITLLRNGGRPEGEEGAKGSAPLDG